MLLAQGRDIIHALTHDIALVQIQTHVLGQQRDIILSFEKLGIPRGW